MTVEELLLSERDDLNEPWDHYDRIIKQLKPVKFVSVKSIPPSQEPSKENTPKGEAPEIKPEKQEPKETKIEKPVQR